MRIRSTTESRSTKLLNECYGTDQKAIFAKLIEEQNELSAAVETGDLSKIKDEASDVLAVLVRYFNNNGWTIDELLEMAIDKATQRKTNPNYKR